MNGRCFKRDERRVAPASLTLALCLPLLLLSLSASAQWHSQSLELHAGWNAVFIEVSPEPGDCASVFVDLPVMSVWTWNSQVPGPRFLRNPDELLPELPEWLTWFPEQSPQSFMTDLHRIVGGRSYLIHLSGDVPDTVELEGRLASPRMRWTADAFNLAGAYVDKENPPSFSEYYGPSKAHADQPVYRLDAQGKWQRVADLEKTLMRQGEAYWIQSLGESEYVGPFELSFATKSKGIYFPASVSEVTLAIKNNSLKSRAISVRLLPSEIPPESSGLAAPAGLVPISYIDLFDQSKTTLEWRPLEDALDLSLMESATLNLRLAVRRRDMDLLKTKSEESLFQGILEVKDADGVVYRAPVSAVRGGSPGADAMSKAYPQELATGLWVGSVRLNQVSKVGDETVLLDTNSEFSVRVIIHVDSAGAATLLHEVIEMADYTGDDADPTAPAMRRVLLTQEDLVANYSGVTARNGEPFGRRISSSTVAFPAGVDQIPMTRSDAVLSGDIHIPYDDPLNPFVHRYHPDHNNQNEDYSQTLSDGDESYTFVRRMSLQFSETDPETGDAVTDPEWGVTTVGGVFTETFYGYKDGQIDLTTGGFNKKPLRSQGVFYLKKVSDVEALNDGQ